MKIRSNLNGPIEFSVKSGNIKIFRSKIQGKPEFLTEITEDQYKELLADETGPFKELLRNNDLQVIKDHDEQEDSENKAFSMEELEDHASKELEAYKTGEGAALLRSSLDEAKDSLELDFADRLQKALDNQKTELDSGFLESLNEYKVTYADEAKTAKDEAIKKATTELKNGLTERHNKEFKSGNLKKW